MRIAINTLMVNREDFGGGEKYLYHLLHNLAKIDIKNQYFIFTNQQNQQRFTINQDNFKTIVCLVGKSKAKRIFYEQFILPKMLKDQKIDIFHGPTNTLPLNLPCPSVLTIQYMFSFIMPEDYRPTYRRWYFNTLSKLSAKRATKIISVSEDNKKQITKFLEVPDSKIEVVHHGLEESFRRITDRRKIEPVLNKYGIGKKYILCVANNVLNKNLERLLKAFSLLKEKYKIPHQLVIAGSEGFIRSRVLKREKIKKAYPDVVFTGFIDHKLLPYLYSGAEIFASPSICESFGMPLLEAMACGVPILTSNVFAMPEVVGEAALKVNPYDYREISRALYALLKDGNLRRKLINNGLERVNQFSWKKAAKETLGIFEKVYEKEQEKARACGILFCYNEEHILKENIKHYLKQGIDLVIIDNYSTDSSMDIVKVFQDSPEQYPGKIRDVIRLKTRGYEWQKILKFACDYMHKNLNHYEWILPIDSDAFFCSPVKDMSLLEFMDMVKKHGYNVIDGKLYEFYPTEKDNPKITSPIERIKYYKVLDQGVHFIVKHHRIFLYHPSINFYSSSGHRCLRENRRVFDRVKFIYKHYPWVNYEQGLKKVFRDRKPRYVEREKHPTWHGKWMGMLPIKKDLIKDPRELQYYKEEEVLLSRYHFFRMMRFGFLSYPWDKLKHFWDTSKFLMYFVKNLNTFSYGSLRNSIRLLFREFKKDVKFLMRTKSKAKTLRGKSRDFISSFKFLLISHKAVIQQEPCAIGFPSVYHFLMTNYCNARCFFCNQKFDPSRKEITFDKFKNMISHIPMEQAKVFHFCGGGEPLLCPELFPIIKYVNNNFPWIDICLRTNGLLIGKYAKEIAELNISRLEISVHGMPEMNNSIIQRKGSEEIFKGIKLLNTYLKDYHKKLYILFYACLSRYNIQEVEELIKKAAELKVNEFTVGFSRYYSEKIKKEKLLNPKDCLFYHKELYDNTIRRAKKLAKSLGLHFEHEPLFSQEFKEKPCLLPWKIVVVDWDGDIYPCTGGEVWFDEKVKSGKYYFGNLLREHLYKSWNNDSYVMIRRTCSHKYRENFIPECKICHNTLCIKGPNDIRRHILNSKFKIQNGTK